MRITKQCSGLGETLMSEEILGFKPPASRSRTKYTRPFGRKWAWEGRGWESLYRTLHGQQVRKKGGCLSGLHVTSEEEDSFVSFKQKGRGPREDQSGFSSCLCLPLTPCLKLVHSFHGVASPHDSILLPSQNLRQMDNSTPQGWAFVKGRMIFMESSLFFIAEME